MGTPAFAVPSLERLAATAHVVGVVSQPARPRGRGLVTAASPVSAAAAALGVPAIAPERIRDPVAQAAIAAWEPDLLVVAAYGKILPRALLELPTLAAVNVHASLLPRHRGAAPIAAAILAGDAETGVTIMEMVEELDAGATLLVRTTPIASDDTTETLTARLAVLGGEALAAALAALRDGGLVPVPQDPAAVTFCPRLTRDDGRVRWSEPAVVLERKVRAFTPWPATAARFAGRGVKILAARLVDGGTTAPPGTVVAVGDTVRVATGDGALDLVTLQAEGKKPLAARAFAAGARLRPGARFDDG